MNLINVIIGYLIIINIIAIAIIWLKVRTDLIKLNDQTLDIIHIIISMLGGVVGTLVGAEMFQYKRESKIFKRWIKLIVFIEICVIIYIVYNIYNS